MKLWRVALIMTILVVWFFGSIFLTLWCAYGCGSEAGITVIMLVAATVSITFLIEKIMR